MADMRIPFFKPAISEDDIDAVVDAMRSGWITSGPNVERGLHHLVESILPES